MKKTLNTDAISNELRGASVFFPTGKNRDLGTTDRPARPAPGSRTPGTRMARQPDAQAPGHRDVQTPRPPDALASRHLDTKLDLNARAESRQTLRLTDGEFRLLGALQADVSEQLGVTKVDKNDILRAGLHRIFGDFEQLGMGSDLVKRLRKKYR